MPHMLRLSLEIELDFDPIRGSLSNAAASPHAFCGWMEFASALHALIEDAQQPTAEGQEVVPDAKRATHGRLGSWSSPTQGAEDG